MSKPWTPSPEFTKQINSQLRSSQALDNSDLSGLSIAQVRALRQSLHTLGSVETFLDTYSLGGEYSTAQLCSAFHVPLSMLDGLGEEAERHVLCQALDFELRGRSRLLGLENVDDVVELIRRGKVIVLAGAGISTSLGIPDFRSTDTGIYAQLEAKGYPGDPQEVFSLELLREDPSIFYTVAPLLYPFPPSPSSLPLSPPSPTSTHLTKAISPTHVFLALLQKRNRLQTLYTQNIDGLELNAGIKASKLVQCHGSFATAECLKCGVVVPGSAIEDALRKTEVPRCQACGGTDDEGQDRKGALETTRKKKTKSRSKLKSKKRKRKRLDSWDDDSSDDDGEHGGDNNGKYDIPEAGVMKPGITFFDQPLSEAYMKRLALDKSTLSTSASASASGQSAQSPNLILAIGTSLKVEPVNRDIVVGLGRNIPVVGIGRERINIKPDKKHGRFEIDMQLLGDCDVVVEELCRRLGWGFDEVDELLPLIKTRIKTRNEGGTAAEAGRRTADGSSGGGGIVVERDQDQDQDQDQAQVCFQFTRVEE